MNDHVSGSVTPQAPVVKVEEGWTSVSNSVRDGANDEPVKLADEKPADEGGDELKSVDETPKAEEKVDAKADEQADEKIDAKADEKAADETADQRDGKRKERSKDRVARLRAEIAAATREKHEAKGTSTATETKPEPKADAVTDEGPKKPLWSEFEAAGKSFEEFLDARDAHVAAELEKKIKADTVKAAEEKIDADRKERAQQEQRQQYRERLDATKAKLTDFDTVIAEGLKEVPATPFFDAVVKQHAFGPEIAYALAKDSDLAYEVAHLQPPKFVFDLIKATDSAEIAVGVLAHLTDNPQVYEDICRSHPIVAAKKLSKIETSLERAHDGSRSERSQSKASPPIRPIGGTRNGATTRSQSSAGSEDILDYIKRENRNEAKRFGYGR